MKCHHLRVIKTPRQCILYGSSVIFQSVGQKNPEWVKYHGVWPRFHVIFGYEKEPVSKRVSLKANSNQFSASLPPVTLGIPSDVLITAQDNLDVCTQIGPLEFAFDFDPTKTAEDLMMDGFKLMLSFAAIKEQYENRFSGSLEDAIGVHVIWNDSEKDPLPSPVIEKEAEVTALQSQLSAADVKIVLEDEMGAQARGRRASCNTDSDLQVEINDMLRARVRSLSSINRYLREKFPSLDFQTLPRDVITSAENVVQSSLVAGSWASRLFAFICLFYGDKPFKLQELYDDGEYLFQLLYPANMNIPSTMRETLQRKLRSMVCHVGVGVWQVVPAASTTIGREGVSNKPGLVPR